MVRGAGLSALGLDAALWPQGPCSGVLGCQNHPFRRSFIADCAVCSRCSVYLGIFGLGGGGEGIIFSSL